MHMYTYTHVYNYIRMHMQLLYTSVLHIRMYKKRTRIHIHMYIHMQLLCYIWLHNQTLSLIVHANTEIKIAEFENKLILTQFKSNISLRPSKFRKSKWKIWMAFYIRFMSNKSGKFSIFKNPPALKNCDIYGYLKQHTCIYMHTHTHIHTYQ